ncbi:MAG: thioredoxin family protein [Eudoraea sp.]|nr:thioredoxin family protein [Eudoraea sp.]
MKRLLLTGYFLFLLLPATSQEWQTDLTTAQKLASVHDLPIVLVFQGSDWCAPCIKLDREIWSTDKFKAYARQHFVMLKADFPKKKANALTVEQQEKNNALAEKYNQNGYFPYVVVMNKDGEVLGTTSYKKMDPTEYISLLESFKS